MKKIKKITVVKKLKDHSSDPFFVKKNEKAAEVLKKYGIPGDLQKKERKAV